VVSGALPEQAVFGQYQAACTPIALAEVQQAVKPGLSCHPLLPAAIAVTHMVFVHAWTRSFLPA